MTSQLKGPFSDAEKRKQSRAKAGLIVNITEDILIFMEDNGITKADISRRLGKSKAYISKLFSGERNMTLNTLSDICFAVDLSPEIILVDSEQKAVNYSPYRHAFMKSIKQKNNTGWHEDADKKIINFGLAARKITKTLSFENEGYRYGCK